MTRLAMILLRHARILEAMLRDKKIADMPEAKALRRRLIGVYGRDSVGNYGAALDHINLMLESDPKNAELQASARPIWPAPEISTRPSSTRINSLVTIPRPTNSTSRKHLPRTTRRCMPRWPQSFAAKKASRNWPSGSWIKWSKSILNRRKRSSNAASSAAAWGNADGARADAEAAYKLKPEDTDRALVHVRSGCRRQRVRQGPRIHRQGEEAASQTTFSCIREPPLLEIRQQVATKADTKQHYDKAMAQIDEGMKKVSGSKAMQMLFFKAEAADPGE